MQSGVELPLFLPVPEPLSRDRSGPFLLLQVGRRVAILALSSLVLAAGCSKKESQTAPSPPDVEVADVVEAQGFDLRRALGGGMVEGQAVDVMGVESRALVFLVKTERDIP